jgi:D-arabinose 1-dehydrogenase-like Zn-dependent alcohol dehydrogenase
MQAMTLPAPGQPLVMTELTRPQPQAHDVVLQVLACGVCRTDLHIVDGDLPPRHAGIVPGHEVVGRVVAAGALARRFPIGSRVGVPWLGGSCGHCAYCAGGRENLCDTPVFTGYDRNGALALCAGIHMSDIPSFPYALLWGERNLRSVANLTRQDGDAFLALVDRCPVTTHVQPFALTQANEAMTALRAGAIDGAAVLVP